MTQRDFILKWLLYALALLPIFVLDLYILPWFPIFGFIPTLFPLVTVTVSVLEGPVGGAGFGLFVGILSDAFIPHSIPGTTTILLTLIGFGIGILARYGVRQNFFGALLCSAATLGFFALIRIIFSLIAGKASLLPLLSVAIPEAALSLVFMPLVYSLFHWVYLRVPQASSVF